MKTPLRSKHLFAVLFSSIFLFWPAVEFRDSFGAVRADHVPDPVLADSSATGSFNVLTYNIAGLPEIISSAKTDRSQSIAEIGRRLNRYDIVHVQEDFNYNQALYGRGNAHQYRSKSKGGVPFGDGLNTLSRFPISGLTRIPWEDCTGADCLTPKGFTFARVQIAKDAFIDLYNIHSNAFNHPKAAAARRKNIDQLSAFMKKKSAQNAVILMGDLNGHYSFTSDNIQNLLINNGLKDAWIALHCDGNFPEPSAELPEKDILHLTNEMESIDKILFRSSENLTLSPSQYGIEAGLFVNAGGIPLSDHLPVGLTFNWELKPERPVMYVKR